MVFRLDPTNILNYLQHQGVCQASQELAEPVEFREANNVVNGKRYRSVISLNVNFTGDEHYLVKQELFIVKAASSYGLKYEWGMQELINNFAQLEPVQSSISEVVQFDAENSIGVIKYLPGYTSLNRFYQDSEDYPTEVASALGTNLARVHRLSFQQSEQREFMAKLADERWGVAPNLLRALERIGPGAFSNICSDGMDFFKLYQRFPSLHQAAAELHQNFRADCLIHSDLRFSNCLVQDKKSLNSDPQIKLVNWEFLNWGDPAFDFGIVVAQYLSLWLDTLYVDSDTDLNLALSLATCPLEKIQPSLQALLQGYLTEFPEITAIRPDFIARIIQFAGLYLIKCIQYRVEKRQPFDNRDICTLQVAKNLLCSPEASISTIFGAVEIKTPATV